MAVPFTYRALLEVWRVMMRRDEKTSHNSLLLAHFRALCELWPVEQEKLRR